METIVLGYPCTDEHVHQISVAARDAEVIAAAQEEIPEKIMQATIFCGHAKVPVDWDKVVQQGRLKWIQSTAAGLDHCLHPPVIQSEISVTGCSGLFANQVAEQTLAILMGLIRRLNTFFEAKRHRIYRRKYTDDLTGKSIGIIGLGGNGQRVAQVLRPFASQIVGTDLFPDQRIDGIDKIFPADALVQVLNQSDVVVITLPLTDKTYQVFGEYEFNAMRPDAYLVNVGRGSVIDTAALIKAIQADKFGGVGLDVVDPEPLPTESPLWDMDNVIITPHVGAQSFRRLTDSTDLFCENIKRYRAGQTLLNLVDKSLGFPTPENRVPQNWRDLYLDQ